VSCPNGRRIRRYDDADVEDPRRCRPCPGLWPSNNTSPSSAWKRREQGGSRTTRGMVDDVRGHQGRQDHIGKGGGGGGAPDLRASAAGGVVGPTGRRCSSPAQSGTGRVGRARVARPRAARELPFVAIKMRRPATRLAGASCSAREGPSPGREQAARRGDSSGPRRHPVPSTRRRSCRSRPGQSSARAAGAHASSASAATEPGGDVAHFVVATNRYLVQDGRGEALPRGPLLRLSVFPALPADLRERKDESAYGRFFIRERGPSAAVAARTLDAAGMARWSSRLAGQPCASCRQNAIGRAMIGARAASSPSGGAVPATGGVAAARRRRSPRRARR